MTSITIGGIISGLDTTSIIDKLVAVQGNQQTLLKNRQTEQNNAITAYSSMLTSIGSLVTQMKSLANTSAWATTSASSSSSSVTATATGSVANSLTFDVTAVAAAHTLISNGSVSSTGAVITSGSTITLGKSDGSSTDINVGTGSLSEVVSAINNANAGISATAVQTSPGNYRLQVTSTSTGEASAFTLSGLTGFTGGVGPEAMNILVDGDDAEITVGGGSGYTVTSASNTFSDIAQGLSFTVSKAETGVTVSSSVDTTGVADQISAFVTNVNNLLSSIQTNTAWDATSKTGGPLLGDSLVRNLQQSILSTVSGMNAPGLSVTSGGQVQFDQTTFDSAYKSDPAATMAAYGASSTFTADGGVTASAVYVNATSATKAGIYNINVTTKAQAETWQVIPPGTGIVGRTIALMRGSTTVSYDLGTTETNTEVAAALNTKLAQAGLGITASVDGSDNLIFTAVNPGTAGAFTVSVNNPNSDVGVSAAQTTAGTDIAGSIDGVAATGIGNILTVPPDADSDAAGLSVQVNSATTGDIGTIEYAPGLAQALSSLFTEMSDSQTGQLVQAQTTAKNQAKDLQTQIDAWTDRLENYRATISAKFTAMESSLASLKTQQSALASFFDSGSTQSSSS